MRARIVKISDKIVVIKTENGEFLKVNKKELDFEYRVGNSITIEKNGKELYFLPDSYDFWDNKTTDDESADGLTTVALITAILLTISNVFTIYCDFSDLFIQEMVSLGVGAVFMIISCLCRNFSKTRNNGAYTAAKIMLWISISGYVLIFAYAFMSYFVINNGKGA